MAKRLKGVPNLPFAPIVAILFGIVAAVLVFATPAWLLERPVASLGISAVLSAAKPPLGDTARLLIAVATGLSVGLILWMVMRPIEKLIHNSRVARPLTSRTEAPHPDTESSDWTTRAARAPIFAGDELGAPLMSDEALASGGELFLDQSMVDAPAAEIEQEAVEPPQGRGWIEFVNDTPEAALDKAPDAQPDPLAVLIPTPAPPPGPTPGIVAVEAPESGDREQEEAEGDEPSLQHLLHRLESALDRRTTLAEQGSPLSNPPPATTVASLRNLIEVSAKNAA